MLLPRLLPAARPLTTGAASREGECWQVGGGDQSNWGLYGQWCREGEGLLEPFSGPSPCLFSVPAELSRQVVQGTMRKDVSVSTHLCLEWPLPASHVVLFTAAVMLAGLSVGRAHAFCRSVSLRRLEGREVKRGRVYASGKRYLDLAFEVP